MINTIPSSFRLFGAKINIIWDNQRMNDMKSYGLAEYSALKITLSDQENFTKLSEDKIKDTYYHEKVHMILDSMGEHELSGNEKFVDIFSKLLRQSEETAEY